MRICPDRKVRAFYCVISKTCDILPQVRRAISPMRFGGYGGINPNEPFMSLTDGLRVDFKV